MKKREEKGSGYKNGEDIHVRKGKKKGGTRLFQNS